MFYIETFIKLLLGLLMATAIIKVTGKTTLAPQSPIDQIQNYILGGIIGGTIYSQDVTIGMFIIVMFIWALISISFYYVRKQFPKISELFDGRTIRVLEKGSIVKNSLKEASLTIDQLYSMLRIQGVGSITQVEVGTIEKNGSLSVILKESTEKNYLIISDGKVNEDETSRSKLTENELTKILTDNGNPNIDDIMILELDERFNVNFIQLESDEKY